MIASGRLTPCGFGVDGKDRFASFTNQQFPRSRSKVTNKRKHASFSLTALRSRDRQWPIVRRGSTPDPTMTPSVHCSHSSCFDLDSETNDRHHRRHSTLLASINPCLSVTSTPLTLVCGDLNSLTLKQSFTSNSKCTHDPCVLHFVYKRINRVSHVVLRHLQVDECHRSSLVCIIVHDGMSCISSFLLSTRFYDKTRYEIGRLESSQKMIDQTHCTGSKGRFKR